MLNSRTHASRHMVERTQGGDLHPGGSGPQWFPTPITRGASMCFLQLAGRRCAGTWPRQNMDRTKFHQGGNPWEKNRSPCKPYPIWGGLWRNLGRRGTPSPHRRPPGGGGGAHSPPTPTPIHTLTVSVVTDTGLSDTEEPDTA